jgi:hypothetical protein
MVRRGESASEGLWLGARLGPVGAVERARQGDLPASQPSCSMTPRPLSQSGGDRPDDDRQTSEIGP